MCDYNRVFPAFISSLTSLTNAEKFFCVIIYSLRSKYGFCWATNDYLAKEGNISPRQVRRYLQKFIRLGLIIVEIEYHNTRKIWTPDTWANRDILIKAYGEAMINQKYARYDKNDIAHGRENSIKDLLGRTSMSRGVGHPCPGSPTPPNKDEDRTLSNELIGVTKPFGEPNGHKISPEKSKPISQEMQPDNSNRFVLHKQMTHGDPPRPGSKEMVAKTKEFLKDPIVWGKKLYFMNEQDKAWFFGFSPDTLRQAISRAQKYKREVAPVKNLVAFLFKLCCEIRKNS